MTPNSNQVILNPCLNRNNNSTLIMQKLNPDVPKQSWRTNKKQTKNKRTTVVKEWKRGTRSIGE